MQIGWGTRSHYRAYFPLSSIMRFRNQEPQQRCVIRYCEKHVRGRNHGSLFICSTVIEDTKSSFFSIEKKNQFRTASRQ